MSTHVGWLVLDEQQQDHIEGCHEDVDAMKKASFRGLTDLTGDDDASSKTRRLAEPTASARASR